MVNSEKPGKLGEISLRIPIRVGFLGLLVSGLFTVLFHFSAEDQKKTLGFFTGLLGTSAGVTSAFYVGQSIKLSAESKKIDAESKKSEMTASSVSRRLELTASYISRWSDPSFDSTRRAVYYIFEKLKDKPSNTHSDIIQKELNEDLSLKLSLLDALNFLEEIALCIQIGIIDEDMAYKFYRSIVQAYCRIFKIWIEKLRQDESNPELFEKLTDLCKQWERKKLKNVV